MKQIKKHKSGWKRIKCLGSNCQYRQKKQVGSPDCKKVGWLKFLIPKIANDRLWLMKITSQQAVDTLYKYFSLQKEQGQSVKGSYILFLKQVENSKDGKTFNNYIIDIIKKEDFISNTTNPQNEENSIKQSTVNKQIVNNNVENNTKKISETPKKEPKKRVAKNSVQKITKIEVSENPNINRCYYFTNHHTEKFMKGGKPKEYFIGEFYDMTDNPANFIVKPDLIDQILECGIGSVLETEIQEFNDKKILTGFKFVQNNEKEAQKNIAA